MALAMIRNRMPDSVASCWAFPVVCAWARDTARLTISKANVWIHFIASSNPRIAADRSVKFFVN